uniref:Uncharacterized protein n=1 Tax=mine drainage metagenome TaxID=410659 RepID=E6PFZ4_9ZZZZ
MRAAHTRTTIAAHRSSLDARGLDKQCQGPRRSLNRSSGATATVVRRIIDLVSFRGVYRIAWNVPRYAAEFTPTSPRGATRGDRIVALLGVTAANSDRVNTSRVAS